MTFLQDAKQSDMLDLEMADYERTIHALNEQLTERNSQLSDARAEIIRLEERLQFMQNQIGRSLEMVVVVYRVTD